MKQNKGMYLLVFSVILFSLMSSLVRVLPGINSTITVFYRFMFSLSIMGILVLLKVFPLQFVRRPLLLLRGLTGGIATYLFYFSIQKLGIGKGTVIVYSYPVFASLFSIILLKEKISIAKWGIILSAFAGFTLLSISHKSISSGFGLYETIALCGAILSAISIVLVKKLHDTDSTYAIFFAQAIVGFWIFVGPANVSQFQLTMQQFFILLGIGITAVGAQLIMTSAYKYVNVSTGSSFYMTVPTVNLLIGVFYFGETLSIYEIIGSLIVITACFVLLRFQKI